MSDDTKPLTDEELDEIERRHAKRAGSVGEPVCGHCSIEASEGAYDEAWPCDAIRLVAEVRRLRSDEWLRAAVEAYYGTHPDPEIAGQRKRLFDRLRKHQDGKA